MTDECLDNRFSGGGSPSNTETKSINHWDILKETQSKLNGDTFSIEAPKISREDSKKNPQVRSFSLRVATNVFEHVFGSFVENVPPFMPTQ